MNTLSTGTEYIKSLKIIHKALVASAIIFSFTCIFLVSKLSFSKSLNDGFNNTINVFVTIMALLGIFVGSYLFKLKIDKIIQFSNSSLSDKLIKYRSAIVIRWAFLEFPMLICIIFLFITSNYYYLIISFVLLVFYIMYAPNMEQIINHLQLNTNEQNILNDEYAEIN